MQCFPVISVTVEYLIVVNHVVMDGVEAIDRRHTACLLVGRRSDCRTHPLHNAQETPVSIKLGDICIML